MKKKESKWKKKRNKRLYPKKNNHIKYFFITILLIIGLLITFRYARDLIFNTNTTVNITETQDDQSYIPRKKPISPIDFDKLEN